MADTRKIGLVGPCGAGKTTLAAGLQQQGFQVRAIAQEHSYVPSMWKRLTNPDILIYLEVSFENTVKRRKLDWTPDEYQEQLRRLSHARQHADLIIPTDHLTIEQVLEAALKFLNQELGKKGKAVV